MTSPMRCFCLYRLVAMVDVCFLTLPKLRRLLDFGSADAIRDLSNSQRHFFLQLRILCDLRECGRAV